jgi:hypothetical protein
MAKTATGTRHPAFLSMLTYIFTVTKTKTATKDATAKKTRRPQTGE